MIGAQFVHPDLISYNLKNRGDFDLWKQNI
jgi:hypothetical protein